MQFQHGILLNDTFMVSDKGCRTQEQYEAFINYFKHTPHTFLTDNPFKMSSNNISYKKTFKVRYYHEKHLNCISITPKGKILIVSSISTNLSHS